MKKLLLLTLMIFTILFTYGQKYELSSPDGKLKSTVEIKSGINVTLSKGEITAIELGKISLETGNKLKDSEYKVQKGIRNSVSEIIKPQIRERAETFINAYNELEIRFKAGHSITFRLFNEGFAYRLSTLSKDSLTIFPQKS